MIYFKEAEGLLSFKLDVRGRFMMMWLRILRKLLTNLVVFGGDRLFSCFDVQRLFLPDLGTYLDRYRSSVGKLEDPVSFVVRKATNQQL